MRRLLLIASLLLGLVLAGCSSSGHTSSAPTLHSIGTGDLTAKILNVKHGQSWVFAIRNLCTEGGPVTIKSVQAANTTGGMHVVDWGVRTRQVGTGVGSEMGNQGTVSQLGGFTHQPITVPCSSKKNLTDFDISAAYSTGTSGTMEGVTLTYDNGQTVQSQYNVTLCEQTGRESGNSGPC